MLNYFIGLLVVLVVLVILVLIYPYVRRHRKYHWIRTHPLVYRPYGNTLLLFGKIHSDWMQSMDTPFGGEEDAELRYETTSQCLYVRSPGRWDNLCDSTYPVQDIRPIDSSWSTVELMMPGFKNVRFTPLKEPNPKFRCRVF